MAGSIATSPQIARLEWEEERVAEDEGREGGAIDQLPVDHLQACSPIINEALSLNLSWNPRWKVFFFSFTLVVIGQTCLKFSIVVFLSSASPPTSCVQTSKH